MLEYNIIRSRRNTLAVRIHKDGTVEVNAPLLIPEYEIRHFVSSKRDWINKYSNIYKEQYEKRKAFCLNFGDYAIILGNSFKIVPGIAGSVKYDPPNIYVPENLNSNEIKSALIQLYKSMAKEYISQRVSVLSKKMCLTPTSIRITGAKTRWGSCSGNNRINFSWMLLMAEADAIDFVIVHELAHIKEHNHSDRFWEIVKEYMPDYVERQNSLKKLQKKIDYEDWGE